MNTRMSVQKVTFRLPGSLFFLINSKLAFYLIVSQRYLAGTAKKKKTLDLERRTVQKTTCCFHDWKPS